VKHLGVSGFATVVFAVLVIAGCGEGESRALADCSRAEAQAAIKDGDFAAVVSRTISEPAGGAGPRPRVLQLECGDVSGDGVEEMVVRVGNGKPSEISPWAIFSDDDGQWTLALARDQVSADLALTDRGVVETQPVYRENDGACCPSGKRRGVVSWDGHGYTYTPDDGTPEREIVLGSATVRQLGSFRPPSGASGATRAFGTPAHTTAIGSSCLRDWPDLGLAVAFASLGVDPPCAGAVQTISLDGLTAEQAGWTTSDGLTIGEDVETLRSQYPNAKRAGTGVPFVLPRAGTVYVLESTDRFGTHVPVLAARVAGGRVVGIDMYVGLAGE